MYLACITAMTACWMKCLHLLEADFQTYYDCLMGPNARSVLMALKRIDKFPVDLIATGHGPLLAHHRDDWVERYRTWSQTQTKAETFVALFYVDEYGHSDRLVRAIADGITKDGGRGRAGGPGGGGSP
jgi:flavorubredoxin